MGERVTLTVSESGGGECRQTEEESSLRIGKSESSSSKGVPEDGSQNIGRLGRR